MIFDDMFDTNRWVLPLVLSEQADATPDKPFVVMAEGGALTYKQANDQAQQVAGYLRDMGVQPGDRVIVMVPTSFDFIRLWLGVARLGATMVALNTELNGTILESQVRRSLATVAIVSSRCLPVFTSAITEYGEGNCQVDTLITVGDHSTESMIHSGVLPQSITFDAWRDASYYEGSFPTYKDIASILYTSGTTGPSKGVLLPHAHCYLYGLGAVENCFMSSDDVNYVVLPLNHVNGLFMQVYSCLIAGATVVLRERFSATNWLKDVIEHGCTMTCVVGAITAFLFAQAPRAEEQAHKLRLVMTGPNLAAHEKVWRERFAMPEVMSCYGMTECNMVTWDRVGETRPNSVGRVYEKYFDVRVVDPETDRPVPVRATGEIVVRPKEPFAFRAG